MVIYNKFNYYYIIKLNKINNLNIYLFNNIIYSILFPFFLFHKFLITINHIHYYYYCLYKFDCLR